MTLSYYTKIFMLKLKLMGFTCREETTLNASEYSHYLDLKIKDSQLTLKIRYGLDIFYITVYYEGVLYYSPLPHSTDINLNEIIDLIDGISNKEFVHLESKLFITN